MSRLVVAAFRRALRCAAALSSTVLSSTVLSSTVLSSTVLSSTVLSSTVLSSTVLSSTAAAANVDAGAPGAAAVYARDVDAGPRPVEVPAEADAGTDAAGREDADAGVARPLPDGFTLTARVEPDPAPFGRVVELVVTITRPARKRIDLPDDIEGSDSLPRSGPARREAKELPAAPSPSAPAAEPGTTTPTTTGEVDATTPRVQETLRFPFLALGLDDLRTPAFTLKTGDGELLDVPSLPVRVQPEVLTDPSDGGAPDGALVVESEAPWIMYRVRDDRPWYALAALAVLALAVVVARWIARFRPAVAKPGPPPPPPRPAHEVALERLDALMPLLPRGEVSLFVEKLMDEVLRDYLALRFALDAGTRTTREIVGDLLGVVAFGLDVGLVERIGQDADLIKFARATLSKEQAHAMAGRVRALILATAVKVPPTSSSPPSSPASDVSGGPR